MRFAILFLISTSLGCALDDDARTTTTDQHATVVDAAVDAAEPTPLDAGDGQANTGGNTTVGHGTPHPAPNV